MNIQAFVDFRHFCPLSFEVPEPLDMDVDEDGAPVLPLPAGKRSNEDTEAIEHSDAKKAKSDPLKVEGAKINDA